ncbi:MAG: putative DNA binding domain-containing protein [Acetatifactor sp.]|nr:putative DNA binding domain-containing protein [Acetatifactor sp.]
MGIPTNIKTLLSGEVVEWARIEFKETWDPAASLKTVCAFANDLDNWGGGYVVIGVKEENGRPVYPLKGVPVNKIDMYQKDIFAKCKLIRPAYMPVIGIETYQNKQFIILWCPGGDTRPYSSPKTMAKDNKERIHYIRKASNTVEPSEDEEKDLFSLANRVPFDDRVNHQAEISDLNITLIQNYLKEVKSSLYEKSRTGDFVEVCSDMNIISNLPEYMKPKNVGLMFFSMEPDKFFPYTQIDVVQFPEGLGGNDIIENTFKGPIHQQLRDALQFIKNTIITEKIVKHPDRAEADRFFNYPYAAVEEALSNAVYHRAYDVREPIEVRVEQDRIEIVSFPGPDRSVTREGLKNYRVSSRRYRNRRIGDFLKEMHLTEGRNTGFKKILDALEINGSPKPEFETDNDHSYFITRLYVHEAFLKENELNKNQKGAKKEPQKSQKRAEKEPKRSQKGAKKEPKKGNERKQAILELLEQNSTMTQIMLMEELNLSRKQVQKDIKELQDDGVLVREGSNRNGRWVVKK